jgi:hypothetical protein
MDMDTVAGVSEAHAGSIFKVEMSRVGIPYVNDFLVLCMALKKESSYLSLSTVPVCIDCVQVTCFYVNVTLQRTQHNSFTWPSLESRYTIKIS